MNWKPQYAALDEEYDVEIVVYQTSAGPWHWSAFDLEAEDGIAVSTVPGFDTPEEAQGAAETWFNTEWLPHYQKTAERS